MDHVLKKNGEHDVRLVKRDGGAERFVATRDDLILIANSQLRAVTEVHAAADGQKRFVRDFVVA